MKIDKTSIFVYENYILNLNSWGYILNIKKKLVPFSRELKISLIQGIVVLKLSNYFYSVIVLWISFLINVICVRNCDPP